MAKSRSAAAYICSTLQSESGWRRQVSSTTQHRQTHCTCNDYAVQKSKPRCSPAHASLCSVRPTPPSSPLPTLYSAKQHHCPTLLSNLLLYKLKDTQANTHRGTQWDKHGYYLEFGFSKGWHVANLCTLICTGHNIDHTIIKKQSALSSYNKMLSQEAFCLKFIFTMFQHSIQTTITVFHTQSCHD